MTTISQKNLLNRIKSELTIIYGPLLKGVLLFGSEARGTAREDSDIDVLVLLDKEVVLSDDMMKISHVIIPIEWELEPHRIIDVTPANNDDYQAGKWPLYREVKNEGIAA